MNCGTSIPAASLLSVTWTARPPARHYRAWAPGTFQELSSYLQLEAVHNLSDIRLPNRVILRTLCVSATLMFTSCGVSVPEPEASLWEGQILPTSSDRIIQGSIAVVSQRGRTEIGIAVQEADPNEGYGWSLVNGSCSEPGDPVVEQLPELVTNSEGSASREVFLNEPLQSNGTYHVPVLGSEDSVSEPVACADLRRRG